MSDFKGPIYISGPMKGIPDSNFPLFKDVSRVLRAEGFETICPTECEKCSLEGEDEYTANLRGDLIELLRRARAIAYLPGWWNSKGATWELLTAMCLGIPCFEVRHTSKNTFLVPVRWNMDKVVQSFYKNWGEAILKANPHELLEAGPPA